MRERWRTMSDLSALTREGRVTMKRILKIAASIQSLALTLFAMSPLAISATGGQSQTPRVFTDINENYTIGLIDPWQPSIYTDAFGRTRTQFVAGNRAEGLLTVSRRSPEGRSLQALIRNDLNDMRDMRLQCESLQASEEEFTQGQLSGTRVSLYYTQSGLKVIGTFYYLQDSAAVWVLRFTASPGSKSLGRESTDRIARSFCPFCPL
jgi:hypothetical protein